MSFKPAYLIAGQLLVVAALSGCTGRYQSSFSVVVENRLAVNTIQLLADGNDMGQVAAGQTASFSLQLPESNANVFTNGVAPTAQGQVTLTAKDLKTGALSADKTLTLSESTPTHVTFASTDFPSSVPTVARFTFSPTNPALNQDVSFNASSSTVSNGVFVWDFGDGQAGGGVTATHQYSRAATFTVVLTVTNDSGQTSTSSRTVTVSAALPATSATFTFSPTTPAINQDVLFTAAAAGAVAGATFAWDFGDGATGSGATVAHRFVRAGTYTASLRVSSNGQTATSSRTVTVSGTLPAGSVNFTFSPTAAAVNDLVYFNASTSTVANATFSWDFGDGSRGTGVAPVHQFARAGTYSVTLTGTNDLGQSASISRTITISATSTQLVANFTFSPTTPSANDTVFFNASSATGATTFTWDFGDGSSGSTVTPTHQYSRGGTYTVTLTVANNIGQSATTSKTVTVSATPFVADFTFSPTDPGITKGTNTVIFDATPSSVGVTTWAWDFGDGSASTPGQKPSHKFLLPGTWVVRLTVTDSTGRTATITKNVTVAP